MSPGIDLHHYAFGILGSDFAFDHPNCSEELDLYGTCFSLKNGIFITAAHVLSGVLSKKYQAIYVWGGRSFVSFYLDKYEIFADYDLAILKTKSVPTVNIREFLWKTS